MSEIPEDIKRAAIQAFEEIAKIQSCLNGNKMMVIARALAAERERCAKVAENASSKANLSVWRPEWAGHDREIAKAIRAGEDQR